MNLGINEPVQINLDADEFSSDAETFPIAKIVSAHAEKRRAEYRHTEKQIQRGLLGSKGYWSESVPWYEWMSEPQVLQSCAEECGLKIWQLAEVIAYKIRPDNWQVFSWMGLALQGRDYGEMITGVLSHHVAQTESMRAQSQLEARTNLAKTGALARLAADPKQKDKATVRECWDDWQKEPDRYKGKAAFARDMLDKFPNLESQPVIEGWCRTWERETKT